MKEEHIFYLVGPTASGKSELAIAVAERLEAEIISADAFQLYQGLPLLTAQPNESMRRRVRHYLLDAIPLAEEMSAAKFRDLALATIAKVVARGRRALVVGGSGLYVKALTHGLAPLPPVDHELRERLSALSIEELNQRLVAVDPLGAQQIDRKNPRRLVRALEIFSQTRQHASAQRLEWSKESTDPAGVFVFRDRAELNERIDRRVVEMLRDGVVSEVQAVRKLSATAVKTLGLREIQQLIAGEISEAKCVAAIQQATRRYAKRQLTWFRRQTNFEPLNLSELKDHEAAVDWILQKVRSAFVPR